MNSNLYVMGNENKLTIGSHSNINVLYLWLKSGKYKIHKIETIFTNVYGLLN